MLTLSSILNFFDLYGIKPQFNINGQVKQCNLINIISSYISIILMLSASIYFSLDLFLKTDVSVISSMVKTNNLLNVTLDKNSFFFMVALEDPHSYDMIIDEQIYTINAYYKIGIRDINSKLIWTSIKLNLTRCSNNYFGEEYLDKLTIVPYNNMYCIPNINHSIYGSYLMQSYSMISLQVIKCRNTTEISKCKSQEEINYYLDGTFITITYQDNAFNPKNYAKPNTPLINHFYSSVSHFFFKELHVYFKTVSIITDSGILFEDKTIRNYTQYAQTVDMLTMKNKDTDIIADISIKLSDYVDEINRSYIKIQVVIANIGGIIKFIYVIFYLLNLLFNQTTFYATLLNNIFMIINDNRSNSNDVLEYNSIDPNQSHPHLIPVKIAAMQKINIDQCKEKKLQVPSINQIRIKYTQQMKISLWMNVMIYCKGQRKKKNVAYYLKGVGLLKQRLNVIGMISESYCNEMMKKVLFNSYQLKLLELVSKPELMLVNKMERRLPYYDLTLMKDNKNITKEAEVIDALFAIKEIKDQSYIDDILLSKAKRYFVE